MRTRSFPPLDKSLQTHKARSSKKSLTHSNSRINCLKVLRIWFYLSLSRSTHKIQKLFTMKSVVLFLVVVLSVSFAFGQTCDPPQIVANARTDNIFTPEQEMVLGELTLQRLSTEFRPIRDPQLLAYVESIGAKLLEKFPNTGLKYTFHIIEYPEANAFNIPGGHVFLTRKLIGFVTSEDELASVIAHELGHAAVRHGAQDISSAMKRVLGISTLGDRKDIVDKYNRLIENARTKRAPARRGHENEQQLEADKLGFFAMVAAGYDPNASFTFFDRL
ncbi:MAG TPA: hypothetical protein DDW24_04830, partial [Blastocatellia bacterium]|nr:hypothetical protein [Blastocatellia bacterium]